MGLGRRVGRGVGLRLEVWVGLVGVGARVEVRVRVRPRPRLKGRSATITVRARGFGSRCVRSVWLGFRTRPPLPLSPHLVDGLRGVLVDGTHPCRDVLERRLVSHIVHLRGGGLGLGLGLG